MLRVTLRAACLFAAVLLLFASAAQASPTDAAKAEARGHYERGLAHFNLREYPQAINEFQAAYRTLPDPVFLYNLAQSYRLSNAAEQALYFYQTYLRAATNASNRSEVEDRIATLEKLIGEKRSAEKAPEPKAPPVEAQTAVQTSSATTSTVPATTTSGSVPVARSEHKPLYRRWWLWTVVGVVVAGAAVGVGVGLATQKSASFNANVGTFGPGALTVRF
jgi:tetratricopeptide (TPR) repeat protein